MTISEEQKEQAIVSWNKLLTHVSDEDELLDWFKQTQESHGLRVGGSYVCTVLRPYFLTRIQLARLSRVSRIVFSAHKKALSAVLNDSELRAKRFRQFDQWVGRVCSFEADIPIHTTALRFDSTFLGGDVRILELNADMPQGVGLNDTLQNVFLGFPGIERFQKEFPFDPLKMQPHFMEALLKEWNGSGGRGTPRFCFVTWRDDPVRWNDMSLNQQYFAAQGFEVIVADVRELEFDGNNLFFKDKRIDIVFRVVGTAESLSRRDEVKALIEADNAGAVLMVNSYRGELLGHKALFAVLSDPGIELGLNSGEKQVVQHNLPWTRLVYEHQTTNPDNKRVDLVSWAAMHKDELVLKPSHDFGGHGVTLGWRSSSSEWEKTLQSALDSEFIIQQRVPLCRELYPTLEPGIPESPFFEDIDPYILGGRFAGILARLSRTEITNVHGGASVGCPFVLHRYRSELPLTRIKRS